MKKLFAKVLAIAALSGSLFVLGTPAGASGPDCYAQCGIANGACHRWCSTNYPCHAACEAQYQACIAQC